MANKSPYDIIKHAYVTEKTQVLAQLKESKSNRCVARCQSPKYVFIVDPLATKRQIALALEEIYKDKQIKVVSVNTIQVKSRERRMRGRTGRTSRFKKAIVTLAPTDSLDNV